MTDEFDGKHVKIMVRTEPEDGYPPEEWEGLWAISVGSERFRIDNIPFYAKNLSCDDVVEARKDINEYIFTRVLTPSENSTIRVVIYDLSYEREIRSNLMSLGCSIEGTGIPGLIAVNVPKTSLAQTLDFVEREFSDERLDYEEGVLR